MTTDEEVPEKYMHPTELATRRATSTQRDDPTRYLCAAAHLDPGFADSAIREFLTEPLRAIPPSPAVDVATVLREAVAARRWRLLRDWSLLAILILFAISGIGLAIAWLLFGLVLTLLTSGWGSHSRAAAAASLDTPILSIAGNAVSVVTRGRKIKLLIGMIVLVVGVVVALSLLPQLFSGHPGGPGSGPTVPSVPSVTLGPFSVVLGLLALIVVVLDKFALSYLLTRSFQRGSFVPAPTVDTWPGERWLRTNGHQNYQRELLRIARADQATDLVVYRGYDPFVGAGDQLEPVAIPIPLDPKKPDKDKKPDKEKDDKDKDTPPTEPKSFTLAQLYDHVAAELMELRNSPSLAPSGRLARLTEHPQVIVPIEELLVNFADPASRFVLPSLKSPPNQTIEPAMLTELIERPLEWMRYYRCFQLETWNRDVTVSAFLHFGVGERMLYLEWIPCVIYPIADEYRSVDSRPIEPLGPLRDGLVEWLRLPGTLLSRLGGMFGRIRPLPTLPGLVQPEKYGARNSLRELAASGIPNNYFQDADILRYRQLLYGRMIRAVGQFLEKKGIEVTEFMAHAQSVGDQYTFNGPVEAAAIGNRNRVRAARNRATTQDKD
jgi:hypothetical protein